MAFQVSDRCPEPCFAFVTSITWGHQLPEWRGLQGALSPSRRAAIATVAKRSPVDANPRLPLVAIGAVGGAGLSARRRSCTRWSDPREQ